MRLFSWLYILIDGTSRNRALAWRLFYYGIRKTSDSILRATPGIERGPCLSPSFDRVCPWKRPCKGPHPSSLLRPGVKPPHGLQERALLPKFLLRVRDVRADREAVGRAAVKAHLVRGPGALEQRLDLRAALGTEKLISFWRVFSLANSSVYPPLVSKQQVWWLNGERIRKK